MIHHSHHPIYQKEKEENIVVACFSFLTTQVLVKTDQWNLTNPSDQWNDRKIGERPRPTF
jgi:hypothetical protein